MGTAFLAQGLISYVSRALRMPIHLMLPGSALAMFGIFTWRVLYSKYLLDVVGSQRILFVGGNPVVEAIATHITEHPELGMAVAGYIDDGTPPGTRRVGGKVRSGTRRHGSKGTYCGSALRLESRKRDKKDHLIAGLFPPLYTPRKSRRYSVRAYQKGRYPSALILAEPPSAGSSQPRRPHIKA
jgi:hypothetical protein